MDHSDAVTLRIADRQLRIVADPRDDLVGASLRRNHTWEPWQLSLYTRLIKPGHICFDIGANIGVNALAMAVHAKGGHVYAFEPVALTRGLLALNVAANQMAHTTTIVPLGLADRTGEARLVVEPRRLGNSRQVGKEFALANGAYLETAQVVRLDDWRRAAGVGLPDFVKIDVEGYEREVLKGAPQSIVGNASAVCIFEFSVDQQREAGMTVFPEVPKDKLFLDFLLETWKHVFLIDRSCRLHPVPHYAALRTMMMKGFPVEDLLCCQEVPAGIADLVAPSVDFPARLLSKTMVGPCGTASIMNRYDDGWAKPLHGLHAVSAVLVQAAEAHDLRLRFPPLHSRHAGVPLHPIMIAAGNECSFVDPRDAEARATPRLAAGTNWVLLESCHTIDGGSYLGNPRDHRQIGFRYLLDEAERQAPAAPPQA